MRVTIQQLKDMKERGERIAMLTAYDYTSAKLVEQADVPVILVGDSLGQVVLGHDSTIPVTMDDMIHHSRAVVRGTEKAHIVVDMPFMSYHAEWPAAVRNAGRLMKEGGVNSVKLEGGRDLTRTVQRMVKAGIPVMGHIGLTPQSVNQLSGYKVQGRSSEQAAELLADAVALEEAGAYAIVLELVPAPLAKLITEKLSIPTIGIGAGPYCDGQVQVFHDVMGLFEDFVPKHTRRYAKLGDEIRQAVWTYVADVKDGRFPTAAESYDLDDVLLSQLSDKK
ncbi:MAG: 3-methyl-2-oxobutanoate hydroxymethyltransferase [Chloroflexi bacterium]|nr:3-methyl-2-oxobutanoate hydroxymethyltransferase [Chloroflexota bacterium]